MPPDRMFVVFDLDGTIADIEHRRHYVDRTLRRPDWPRFFDACDADLPHRHVIAVLHALAATGHRVEIWSARSDIVRGKTEAWLARHGLGGVPLRMREARDNTPDEILKRRWLDAAEPRPDLIFDDRDKVVAMWRAAGVPCCQVSPGTF